MAQRADLGHGNVKKLLFSLSVPTITSQIVNLLYNLVDRVFIGHMQPAETVGKLALTGVGVCLPIIMIISAFASLMAIGGAPRASIADGAGESERSERIMGNCLTMLLITSFVLTILFEVFAERLLLLFGASENTVGYALDYMRMRKIDSDFGRTERQRKTMMAIYSQAMARKDVTQMYNLVREGFNLVKTNLKLSEMLDLAQSVISMGSELNIGSESVPPKSTKKLMWSNRYIDRKSVLWIDNLDDAKKYVVGMIYGN